MAKSKWIKIDSVQSDNAISGQNNYTTNYRLIETFTYNKGTETEEKLITIKVDFYSNTSSSSGHQNVSFLTNNGWEVLGTKISISAKTASTVKYNNQIDCRKGALEETSKLWVTASKRYVERTMKGL